MVTPTENDDADVYVPRSPVEELLSGEGDIRTRLLFQAAASGGAIAYVGDSTVGGTGSTGLALGNEYLASYRQGVGGGWHQVNLQPLADKSAYYQAFSSDLSVGILQQGDGVLPALSEEAPAGYKVLYQHPTSGGGSGIYRPFFTVTPPKRSPEELSSSEFHTFGFPRTASLGGILAFAGGSVGLGAVLFEANDALTAGAVDGGVDENNLYVSVDGRLGLVNVLPDGLSEANATFGGLGAGGEALPDFSHVISADGSRVFWTDLNTGDLYVSEGVSGRDERSLEVDTSQNPGATGGGGQFWTASADGSRVFFTDPKQLTVGSTAAQGESDLYEYEMASQEDEAGRLVDLTVDGTPGGHAGVQGVLGASEDGSYVYFVANGVLASNTNAEDAGAAAGEDNLYVWHREPGQEPSIRFITTLSSNDSGDWQPGLGNRTAQVTPSGGSLVFESGNQDVEGYSPEAEGSKVSGVYVYEYRSNRLFCASCDTEFKSSEVNRFVLYGSFLPESWSATYLPNWMSEDGGRVVFDSADQLVPWDTNGKPDVYEWERDGTGSCVESEGCLSLLSGGASTSASWLAGESATGNDVFVISREQFTPEDHEETFNLFDARVGGLLPVSEPACTGTGCQGLPIERPLFATPGGRYVPGCWESSAIRRTPGQAQEGEAIEEKAAAEGDESVSGL